VSDVYVKASARRRSRSRVRGPRFRTIEAEGWVQVVTGRNRSIGGTGSVRILWRFGGTQFENAIVRTVTGILILVVGAGRNRADTSI
jgi:hypothetical protein